MASSYALPMNRGSHHGHSRSYSAIHLSPNGAGQGAFPTSNGSFVKNAASNGSLYPHAENGRETSPLPSPNDEQVQYNYPVRNLTAYQESYGLQKQHHHHNHRHHHHHHSHPASASPMKARARGESDLGRPADAHSHVYKPSLESIPTASSSCFSLPEALAGLLIPLPYVFASAAYSSNLGPSTEDGFPPLSAYAKLQKAVLTATSELPPRQHPRPSGLVEALTLASGTLLLLGVLAKIRSSERLLNRRKDAVNLSIQLNGLASATSLRAAATRGMSLSLPFYAATQIGGMRTGLVVLVAIVANLTCSDTSTRLSYHEWQQVLSSRLSTVLAILLCLAADFAGLTIHARTTDLVLGYLALAVSILVLQPPLPALAVAYPSKASSKSTTPTSTSAPWSKPSAEWVLSASVGEANLNLFAGVLLFIMALAASVVLSTAPSMAPEAMLFSVFSVGTMAASIAFANPSLLRSPQKAGLSVGCLFTASCAFLFSPSLWPGTVCNGGLSALAWFGVLYDTSSTTTSKHHHDHDHDHAHNAKTHHHAHHGTSGSGSFVTSFFLSLCEPGSLVHTILSEKDSRRIAYFTCLNFGFMLVQGLYGYLSGSLGLLSDTVHMFFDCLGLVVGLGAAIASKWPTSPEKPYGWGKLNTLSGFGNGIFLMLVSVEFAWEAIEGLMEGSELRHVEELLVVSTLGLLVNMVGLFAFGHAHAGHDHGHSHGHSHGHLHGHSDGHDHSQMNGHAHSHDCDHDHESKKHDAHGHGAHDHGNENMHGIFLHVAADAGGSLAVIISTALTLWKPWYIWDPLATIIIAILIFAAAVPLVTSSGQKLLLVIPDELEYSIKNMLQEVGEMRGVVGYAVPRFWVDDREAAAEAHGHHHEHDHRSREKKRLMGVVHVIAAPSADVEDVRERVDGYARERNMDLVIHVEREGEVQCWCGGGQKSG